LWFTQKCATPSEFNGEENGVRYHDIKWCAVSRHKMVCGITTQNGVRYHDIKWYAVSRHKMVCGITT